MRQLAAIMFSDLVGFTARMQEDEGGARELVRQHRDVLERAVTADDGETLQFYGDGALTVFPSAVNAVDCAVRIQQELAESGSTKLRIGLHVGDVIQDELGVYGDGVNVAARIQELGVPGSILLSARVRDEIKNHPRIRVRPLGEYRLKNVKQPLGILAVEAEGLVIPPPEDLPTAQNEKQKSIAVLPFENMSPDPENEYFCDGIAEEIINVLAGLPGLKVAGRTSAFSFKGRVLDVREIGTKLNVGTVLSGSVRKMGDRLRITAQLVDVTNGYHLWSERFDRRLDDVFAIQDEIATNIAERLELTIGGTARQSRPTTEDVEAYELYLKGRALLYQRGMAMFRAQKCFEQALTRDTQYALAHAGLADSYSILGYYGLIAPPEAWPRARQAADRAVALAPDLAEAHNALAIIAFVRDWDWPTAGREFQRSLELNPSYVQARCWHAVAYLQATRGDHEAAIAEARVAVDIDPLSAYTHMMLAYVLVFAGRTGEAVEEACRAAESDPDSYWGQFVLATAYHSAARISEAENAYRRALSASGRNPLALANLGRLYAESERSADASAVDAELMARSRQEYVQPSTLALAAACAGRAEEALALLQQAYQERDPWLAWGALASPWFEPLRRLAGYEEMLTRMKLPTTGPPVGSGQ